MLPTRQYLLVATTCLAAAALPAQDAPKARTVAPTPTARPLPAAERPFGTLKEQAKVQQEWLQKRLDGTLPALMRKHGIDLWVVPMREYNEDPVFASITAPETMAARRRTIYVFFDKCAAANQAPKPDCVERIALGGTSGEGAEHLLARPHRQRVDRPNRTATLIPNYGVRIVHA